MKFLKEHALFAGPLLVFLFALGIHHHFLFFLENGDWTYFKNAYDEETYMIWYDQWKVSHFRWLSAGFYSFLKLIVDKTLIPMLADSFLPVVFGIGFIWYYFAISSRSVFSAKCYNF